MLKKILVVDDSALIHHMFRMVLGRYKCDIVAAQNGKMGMEKLAQHPDVELVLLDINMPVMTGLEFIAKVKELGIYEHIPIIIVSTEGEEEFTERGMALGASGYVTKPVKPSDLHALIETICATRG